MVEAVVVLVLPPSLRNFILVDTGMMWCLGHIIFIAQNPLFWYHLLIILQLVLLLVIHLLKAAGGGKGSAGTSSTYLASQKCILGFMVVIFCSCLVDIIHSWDISNNSSPIIHHIWVLRIYLALMVVLEVILVPVLPTSFPRKFILEETDMISGFSHLSIIVKH